MHSWTYCHTYSILFGSINPKQISIYLNVSSNRTPLMIFDPKIPTRITLWGINVPHTWHTKPIRLCRAEAGDRWAWAPVRSPASPSPLEPPLKWMMLCTGVYGEPPILIPVSPKILSAPAAPFILKSLPTALRLCAKKDMNNTKIVKPTKSLRDWLTDRHTHNPMHP